MPGGLVQIALKGKEDAMFSSSASTHWKGVYRQPSNFARETIPVPFKQDVALGQSVTCVVDRLGDLVCGITLEITATKAAGAFVGAYYPAEALIKEAEIRIGGQVLDRHNGDWMRIYDSLHRSYEKSQQYARITNFDAAIINSTSPATQTIYLPLSFSFCRHPACALPLVAMPFAEVALHLTLADAATAGIEAAGFKMRCLVHYVYLDHQERLTLVNTPLDILTEQTQIQRFTLPVDVPSVNGPTSFHAKLGLYRPVKTLYWFLKGDDTQHGRFFGDSQHATLALTPHPATPSGLALTEPIPEYMGPVLTSRLLLDGQERMKEQPGTYFNKYTPFESYSGCPLPGVYSISFALYPEQASPSGYCNFSPLTDARLELLMKRSAAEFDGDEKTGVNTNQLNTLVVIGWGYNILRVEKGMASVVFR